MNGILRIWAAAMMLTMATILGGCGRASLPAGVIQASRAWAIVGNRGEVFDLESRKSYPLAPYVRSLVGEDLFRPLQMPNVPRKLYQAMSSPDGRFLACLASDERLCMVDVKEGTYVFVEPPEPRMEVSIGAWNPQQPRLVCAVYSSHDDDSKGYLYLLSYESHRWSWQRLAAAGEMIRRGDQTVLSEGAWADEQRILYVSDGKVHSLGMNGGAPIILAEGIEAYSLRDGSFICRKRFGLSPCVLIRPAAPGETGTETRLEGDGVTMSSCPALSPDGRYALFIETSIESVYGHAGISYDVCLYDLQARKFYRVIDGYWAGPSVEAVIRAVWIQDANGLRNQAGMRQ